MKLKVSALFAAYITLTTIINEKRELPQKGKYRIARLHEKLRSEFQIASAQRDELVEQFGEEVKNEAGVATGDWLVKQESEKFKPYMEAWSKIADEEIEIEAQPIPLDSLGDSGSIEAYEFLALGDLVAE